MMGLFTASDLQGLPGLYGSGSSASPAPQKDIFAEKKRNAWHDVNDKAMEARCDLSIEKTAITYRAGNLVLSLWKKSLKGRTLNDIKADDAMVPYFANRLAPLIRSVLGEHLDKGGYALCATPKRRHLTQNFACRIAEEVASQLHIPYYEDVAIAHSRHRTNAVFELGFLPPEPNIIVLDDFVTTGSTLNSMKNLLTPLGKNLFLVVGINNNM